MREWWELRPTAFINFLIFIIMNELKFNPAITAIRRARPSRPLQVIEKAGMLLSSYTILDYGCGYGADVDYLRKKGFCVDGYDPYQINTPYMHVGVGLYDVILCTYVLNVLENKLDEFQVLGHIYTLLADKGEVYISVRRDLSQDIRTYVHGSAYHVQRYVKLDTRYFDLAVENRSFALYVTNKEKLGAYIKEG